MGVHVSTLRSPWLWWEYLTAGFAHSPTNYNHIVGNMLGLFFLGRDVEAAYGRKEFLRLYLVMVIFASFVWNVANLLAGPAAGLVKEIGPAQATAVWQNVMVAYGASGAIAGVVTLYALNFPHRTLLLFFVIPIPAWLLGAGIVVWDILGATGRAGDANIAYSMHLAGAAFAFIYYHRGWNLTQWTSGIRWPKFDRPPRLRVHAPPEDEHVSNLSEEVDHILEKIYREGEASLTAKERKTLETASREYQRKVHTGGHDAGKRT
jgi:membrane associated rhomboid family serine protease